MSVRAESVRSSAAARQRPRLPIGVAALIAAALVSGVAAWLQLGGGGPGFHDASPPAEALAVTTPAQALADGRRALALVEVPSLDLGYELRFEPRNPGSSVRGETDRRARTITIFVSSADATHVVAHDVAHELAHAVDDRLLSDAQRRAYLERRGIANTAWWPGGSFSDYRSGAGDFAEVFALCHSASPEYRSRLAARPANPCALLPDLPKAGDGERMGLR